MGGGGRLCKPAWAGLATSRQSCRAISSKQANQPLSRDPQPWALGLGTWDLGTCQLSRADGRPSSSVLPNWGVARGMRRRATYVATKSPNGKRPASEVGNSAHLEFWPRLGFHAIEMGLPRDSQTDPLVHPIVMRPATRATARAHLPHLFKCPSIHQLSTLAWPRPALTCILLVLGCPGASRARALFLLSFPDSSSLLLPLASTTTVADLRPNPAPPIEPLLFRSRPAPVVSSTQRHCACNGPTSEPYDRHRPRRRHSTTPGHTISHC
ncbi:hypothetical protein B0T26DRAFT_318280 [Lasiosphaeria miniovina]|uniref:Uncharacterized protein n=1 Tax=Lasiosphaeria miniovina TaxID=1954250 RepID=A0AA40ALS6_9PEZI|nr:uncharacterized protein B0T26DRAFT_318280 [Lasiosphaeria miniovina]KAK0718186.1 hypothetical protein B0T26DRAFT_318280 [Lasiosphaeria miniovina]